MTDSTGAQPARIRCGGRRAFFALILLATLSTLWWRSQTNCYALAIFGPSGKVGGVVFHRGQIWAVFSNIRMGQPWTAQTASASLDEGDDLQALLIESGGGPTKAGTAYAPAAVARRWNFFLASRRTDAFSLKGAWCTTMGGPAWIFLSLAAWPVATWIIRRTRLWRRRRHGWCLECGYDLRGGEERCPECGRINLPQRSVTVPL